MSDDIHIRIEGRAGRITLTRPKALNALGHDMCLAVENALDAWADDDAVALVIIGGAGDKAFCAGGDIQKLYDTGRAGDFEYGRRFWRDEYRLNAKIVEYPKPYISFLHGFTMGGGVGIGCHGSHRIICESSQIAMPECSIGLVPDVGGSLLLARAPGHLGEYLGLTGARMEPGDAIHAGFADHYIPAAHWPGLVEALCTTGDVEAALTPMGETPPQGPLRAAQADIDMLFGAGTLPGILDALRSQSGELAQQALEKIARNAPLSMACTVEMLRRLRAESAGIRAALAQEYRFTARAMESGDFLEGIRAQIIDRDRQPRWRHTLDTLPADAADTMLAPLGEHELTFATGG
ncbi:MAG: enoyl-CoA hydratase/isomerase family protein [Pseudomonadota bacterium]|uniref:enoyl-CoA hydratase/isomerase family protein n=1 Tax=Roseovarius TaxID=74030 RepID=UPI0022A74B13|nr:enoyl-CoA hydratase/isomerase family protein [Roseovarius sp. EGI FJ00037]MCZ0810749.1 enoyl-CoA hydratase/isomerase family protein [Roseovarius sp. EGI FJ00037]